MKANSIWQKLIRSFFIVVLTTFIILPSCSDDVYDPGESAPEFVSANVDNTVKSQINVRFSIAINTTAAGFTIMVDEIEASITEVTGSGSSYISFSINTEVQYNQSVTIAYSATQGNAASTSGMRLSSFTPKQVSNYIEETYFTVLIPNLPPEAKDDTIWLVIKTAEASTSWEWDYKPAAINISLTALPETTPFDVIIYAPEDGSWRPHKDFTNGYYATLLNQTNIYQELKVVSWLKSASLSGTDMGNINSLYTTDENKDIENALLIRTDGMDYVEGNVTLSNKLWYKFVTTAGINYEVIIKDNYAYSDHFTGVAKGTLCDNYGIPLANIPTIIGSHSTTFSGNGEVIYIRVEVSDLGGEPGNFQILVEEE